MKPVLGHVRQKGRQLAAEAVRRRTGVQEAENASNGNLPLLSRKKELLYKDGLGEPRFQNSTPDSLGYD